MCCQGRTKKKPVVEVGPVSDTVLAITGRAVVRTSPTGSYLGLVERRWKNYNRNRGRRNESHRAQFSNVFQTSLICFSKFFRRKFFYALKKGKTVVS